MSEKSTPENKTFMSKKSKRKIEKKLLEKKRRKEKREKQVQKAWNNNSDTISGDRLKETSYYYENGLRKVYPYFFTFSTYAKGRWCGKNLLNVFTDEFRFSHAETVFQIEQGKVTVNGKEISTSYIIKNGDFIQNKTHRHELPVTNEKIKILADTETLLVVNKPSSVPIHPCGRYRHNSLMYILAKDYGFTNLRSIYRLDRLTSGLMIFSKNEGKANQMSSAIQNRLVEKEYVCRIKGDFPQGVIECKEPLSFLSHKLGLVKVDPNGKSAYTIFEKITSDGSTSVVKCKPHTGRTHQIRVHLQYLGYPVVNDPMYRGALWGPHEGKGGAFGRPDQDIIEDIIRMHNKEEWCIDNNTSGTALMDSSTVIDLNSSDIRDSSEIHDCGNKEEIDVPTCIDSVTQSEQINHQTKDIGSVLKRVVSNESDEETKNKKLKSDSVIIKNESECVDLLPVKKTSNSIHPPFVSSLMSFDPDCKECKLKYQDPQTHSLVMYLHAYRYKGPDWEYSTDLPAWADENWGEKRE